MVLVVHHAKLLECGGQTGVVWSWFAFILLHGMLWPDDGFELSHCHHRKCRKTMVLCGHVMLLVDWDRGVNVLALDSLLVDDWLDELMNVMVMVSANDLWHMLVRMRVWHSH